MGFAKAGTTAFRLGGRYALWKFVHEAQQAIRCPECEGTGSTPWEPWEYQDPPLNPGPTDTKVCEACGGAGEVTPLIAGHELYWFEHIKKAFGG